MTGLGAVLAAALLGQATEAPSRLEVHGTEFVLVRKGRELRGHDLIGARLTVSGLADDLAIESSRRDPATFGGSVTLYGLTVIDETGRSQAFCGRDSDGERLGFPIADGLGGYALACTSGAIGKCVRWGYRP